MGEIGDRKTAHNIWPMERGGHVQAEVKDLESVLEETMYGNVFFFVFFFTSRR